MLGHQLENSLPHRLIIMALQLNPAPLAHRLARQVGAHTSLAKRVQELTARGQDLGGNLDLRIEAGPQLLRAVRGQDAPLVDDDDAIAHLLDLRQDMTRNQDGMMTGQLLQEGAHPAYLVGIEPDRGLVQNEHIGVVQQAVGNPHTLAIPLGQLADDAATYIGEVATLADFLHATFDPATGNALEAPPVGKIFPHAHVRTEEYVLGHVADARTYLQRMRAHIEPIDRHPSTRRRQIAGQHAHGGRLAGPVGTQHTDNFPAIDRKADAIDRTDGTKSLDQIFHDNHRQHAPSAENEG